MQFGNLHDRGTRAAGQQSHRRQSRAAVIETRTPGQQLGVRLVTCLLHWRCIDRLIGWRCFVTAQVFVDQIDRRLVARGDAESLFDDE